jgi:hypothetical protein
MPPVAYLLRLVLPDRPGTLGAVATALGHVGADIMSFDIVERSIGEATDDLVVDLPSDKLADSVVSAALTVPGVRVTSIRPYAGQIDPFHELDLIEHLATRPPDAATALADGVCRIFRAGWALLLNTPHPECAEADVRARSTAAPEITGLAVPWWPAKPARPLSATPDWAPADWSTLGTELAVAPLGSDAILLGRPALHWLPSEILRLSHLASIAATVLQPLQD